MNLNKINLEQLITGAKDDYIDNTSLIRELKHSILIHTDVSRILFNIAEYNTIEQAILNNTIIEYINSSNPPIIRDYLIYDENINSYSCDKIKLNDYCRSDCSFLFINYNIIYKMVLNQEINLNMLTQVLNVLGKIENNEIDQHDGSVEVGKLLYTLFSDSKNQRINNDNKIDALEQATKKIEVDKPTQKITWKEYKAKQNIITYNN